MLERFEKVRLAQIPTPVHELTRLGKEIGLSRFFAKRDDLTGIELSGNKARKLEFEFAQVLKQQCDTVLTIGGVQSNHARITAAFARKLGLDVKLALGGTEPEAKQGNLLLDSLMGAEVRYVKDDSNENLLAEMGKWAAELKRAGKKPYEIPLGGSTPLGALGYVEAMQELAPDFAREKINIIVAVGSCGTLAGTVLGAKIFLPKANVIGISVSRTASEIMGRTVGLARESGELLGSNIRVFESDFEVHDGYHDGYATFTELGKQAILLAARTEGLLLDPVYTGKAMAGLIDLCRKNKIDKSIPVIFLHTGGSPILYAYEKNFRHSV